MKCKPIHIAIIIPVLNEEKAIQKVINAIPKKWHPSIIVSDNGSTDQTQDIVSSLGVKTISTLKKGYGRACLNALSNMSEDKDIIVFLDGDFSDDPSCLDALLLPIINNEADFVLGVRDKHLREEGSLTKTQVYGNTLVVLIIQFLYGFRYMDLGPFRAIRYSSLKSLRMMDLNFGWNVEMQIKAIRQNLRIKEINVPYRKRIGFSKISGTVVGTVKAGIKMLYATVRYGL